MIIQSYNLQSSTKKSTVTALYEKQPIKSKILVINDQPIDQVQFFTFLGCQLTHLAEDDTDLKFTDYNYMCGIIGRAMRRKARLEARQKS
jgi:hypothetical protein